VQEHFGAFRALGAQVVAITQSKPEVLAAQLRTEPRPFPFLCDPERQAYRAFGLERGSKAMFFRPRVLLHYLRQMLRGWRIRRPGLGEDVLQLGGDFILDGNGRVAFAHPSTDPSDRPAMDMLLRELKTLTAHVGTGRATEGLPP
jgi:peroxiredoxin